MRAFISAALLSLSSLVLPPHNRRTAHGHGHLALPASKNGGDLTTSVQDTGTYYSIASFGIIDKAFFDGDHSITPWQRPGEFDAALARSVIPAHPQTLHPCGCNAGGIAHCAAVEVAAGFGETTLGAAPGIPPTRIPPEWPTSSSQEVGWNAYANHAGGYVYTLCGRTEYDACKATHLPNGASSATEEQANAYLDCVWGCFEATTLEWVPGSQKVQYRDDACSYARTDALTKVGKGGYVWRSSPIPDLAQVTNGNEGQCTWDSVVDFSNALAEEKFTESFGTSDICDTGRDQRSTKDWHIMDKVNLPAEMPEGEYLLGWRWDALMADQMWTGCADVKIVAPSQTVALSEPDCPTGPPPVTNPPPTNPPPTNSPPTTSNTRCGVTFDDANGNCGAPCDAYGLCPVPGEGCFTDLSIEACAPPPVSSRCGLTFDDANEKCGAPCDGNGLCASPEEGCFADLSVQPCMTSSPTSAPTPEPSPEPSSAPTQTPISTTRCGLNAMDARSKCGATCGPKGLCSSPEEGCFTELSVDACASSS